MEFPYFLKAHSSNKRDLARSRPRPINKAYRQLYERGPRWSLGAPVSKIRGVFRCSKGAYQSPETQTTVLADKRPRDCTQNRLRLTHGSDANIREQNIAFGSQNCIMLFRGTTAKLYTIIHHYGASLFVTSAFMCTRAN